MAAATVTVSTFVHRTGMRAFNSSNQFWTTMIRGAAAGLAGGLTMRKRWPSPDTS